MIKNETEFKAAQIELDILLKKGFENLSEKEDLQLIELTNSIKIYEDIHYPLPFKNEED